MNELKQEAETTRRVLERIPENQLSWALHPKLMTLGQLTFHASMLPGSIAEPYTATEKKKHYVVRQMTKEDQKARLLKRW
jgi:hypothetical protein